MPDLMRRSPVPDITIDDVSHVMRLTAGPDPAAAWAAIDALTVRLYDRRLFTALNHLIATAEVERLYSSHPDAYPLGGRKQQAGHALGQEDARRGRTVYLPRRRRHRTHLLRPRADLQPGRGRHGERARHAGRTLHGKPEHLRCRRPVQRGRCAAACDYRGADAATDPVSQRVVARPCGRSGRQGVGRLEPGIGVAGAEGDAIGRRAARLGEVRAVASG